MKTLTSADFISAARDLVCDVATVRAVCEVEAPHGGFLSTGDPVILFEAHVFSRLTGHRYDKSNPSVSSFAWNRSLYSGGLLEYARLQEALALDREAALKSTSWGRFQIMGFNFARCGFANVESFVATMKLSEGRQLAAFVAFVKSAGLDDELRRHDWPAFARGYNGPGYAANQYDQRLATAHAAYAGAGPDQRVV